MGKKKSKTTIEQMMDHMITMTYTPCFKCKGVMFVRVPGRCGHWKPCPKCNKEMK